MFLYGIVGPEWTLEPNDIVVLNTDKQMPDKYHFWQMCLSNATVITKEIQNIRNKNCCNYPKIRTMWFYQGYRKPIFCRFRPIFSL